MRRDSAYRLSVWQFSLSALAAFGVWATAISILSFAGSQSSVSGGFTAQTGSFILMSAGLGAVGLMLLLSAGYALWRISERTGDPFAWLNRLRFSPLQYLAASLVTLLAGAVLSRQPALAFVFLPLLHVLALSLPVAGYYSWGSRGLGLGSPQRIWGVFAGGLVLSPLLIFILELFALLVSGILIGLFIAGSASRLEELAFLLQRILLSYPSTFALRQMLAPYLFDPLLAFWVFAFAAGVVPLLEEALKPIGVWLLFGRALSPAQGFCAGLLSGAGFALFEGFILASRIDGWLYAVVGRLGTSLIHITTAGLTGWALAVTFRSKGASQHRQGLLRLAIVYIATVVFHGLWNSLVLLIVAVDYFGPDLTDGGFWMSMGRAAPFGLLLLAVLAGVLLFAMNRSLIRNQSDQISVVSLGTFHQENS